ncbi:MAG: D-alanine--D-alanine ligase [Clostridiales Family XIII bacterium]|jgi:D-alanine-D-alanine ligase|nr:D-alanine--D-alanine ligase [Clostridiales Family XIII bacterium]
MDKKRIAVIFGGVSSEHDVSMVSASAIMEALKEHVLVPVYITREGKWLVYEGAFADPRSVAWERDGTPVIFGQNKNDRGLFKITGDRIEPMAIDVIFPVLHGRNGEDGTIQGLFELSAIPYVGCGVLSSAICMDKAFTKMVAATLAVHQAEYLILHADAAGRGAECKKKVDGQIGYPCYVKPANAGSSVGVSKVNDSDGLQAALNLAFQHDRKAVVEKNIVGRELECAVLGNQNPRASCVGEIETTEAFYDYDAKYNNPSSRTIVPADISENISKEIQRTAVEIYAACECSGLARVDFFLEQKTGRIIFNEINTLPGFTPISMYPMLWEHMGLSAKQLCEQLVELAFQKKNAPSP